MITLGFYVTLRCHRDAAGAACRCNGAVVWVDGERHLGDAQGADVPLRRALAASLATLPARGEAHGSSPPRHPVRESASNVVEAANDHAVDRLIYQGSLRLKPPRRQ